VVFFAVTFLLQYAIDSMSSPQEYPDKLTLTPICRKKDYWDFKEDTSQSRHSDILLEFWQESLPVLILQLGILGKLPLNHQSLLIITQRARATNIN